MSRGDAEPWAPLDGIALAEARDWEDIHGVLDELERGHDAPPPEPVRAARAIGFLTFEYGIDGVSMEIAKYAACFESLLERRGARPAIHCIAGDFSESVEHVILPRWQRHRIPQANGWSKWNEGRDFARLFLEDMPEGSAASQQMAHSLFAQAQTLTRALLETVRRHGIDLLVVVNVNSNPGNPALALATVLASESAALPVLHCGHDFFWESGRPASQRKPDEAPGVRDHFFRNYENRAFFRLIDRLYPWNGQRWIQLVINELQRDTLRTLGHIPGRRLQTLGTFIEDSFFTPWSQERRDELRARLGLILGRGKRSVRVTGLKEFRADVDAWMADQMPVVCGSESDRSYDVADRQAIWILQPTRVVTRKRVEWDWALIGALLAYGPFRTLFEERPELTLTLHVTGPVPREHRGDLLTVLDAYRGVLDTLPAALQRRIFLAFSAGRLGHSAFQERRLEDLTVADLYQLADLILLPSETEGRGLPILEAAAAGRPLVCSRYEPREVFTGVVGEDLDPELQIHYTEFPEPGDHIDTGLLQEITDAVFMPQCLASRSLHNRRAVASRFGMRDMIRTFSEALERLDERDEDD